ncbi:MAG: 5'-methylthioadenosine/adenosylhomocysteine nucleosidase [Ruminococcaceae bacterium]|nr:5'-methylthioadenosine/adenosylhomocysteine nucleosidase [Oscillospiraceae bacterium]
MKLGIIAAMSIEAEQIIAALDSRTVEKVGGIDYTVGKIGNTELIVAVCGIGKVFAAMCTQAMIVRFAPDAVINTGVGGTLTKELTIGDACISSAVVQHDMDTSPLGDPVGLISGINIIHIPADEALGDKILALCADEGIHAIKGTIASGDQFIADSGVKEKIISRFGGKVCEMEGASVGQVCYVNGVPFVIVRAISDDADGDAVEDYPAFAKRSADRSARVVIRLAQSL